MCRAGRVPSEPTRVGTGCPCQTALRRPPPRSCRQGLPSSETVPSLSQPGSEASQGAVATQRREVRSPCLAVCLRVRTCATGPPTRRPGPGREQKGRVHRLGLPLPHSPGAVPPRADSGASCCSFTSPWVPAGDQRLAPPSSGFRDVSGVGVAARWALCPPLAFLHIFSSRPSSTPPLSPVPAPRLAASQHCSAWLAARLPPCPQPPPCAVAPAGGSWGRLSGPLLCCPSSPHGWPPPRHRGWELGLLRARLFLMPSAQEINIPPPPPRPGQTDTPEDAPFSLGRPISSDRLPLTLLTVPPSGAPLTLDALQEDSVTPASHR